MISLQDFQKKWYDQSSMIEVHSSGSTGTPKSFFVEKGKMLASAKMTCDFLHLKPGDSALLCLSLDHIGGQMMVVRAIERNLKLISINPCGNPLKETIGHIDFAAMVPLQVFNSLQKKEEREKLCRIKNIIIGGGAISTQLEKDIRSLPNNIWSTYGMTETLSHIALRKLTGNDASEWYTPFNGVKIRLNREECICISAPHICQNEIITNDVGIINSTGQFKILGRKDNIINTGGIKVQIEEIEKILKENEETNIAIGSFNDDKFGQIIILLTTYTTTDIQQRIDKLPKYWRPKKIIHVKEIPMTNGKIAREQVQFIINQTLQ